MRSYSLNWLLTRKGVLIRFAYIPYYNRVSYIMMRQCLCLLKSVESVFGQKKKDGNGTLVADQFLMVSGS